MRLLSNVASWSSLPIFMTEISPDHATRSKKIYQNLGRTFKGINTKKIEPKRGKNVISMAWKPNLASLICKVHMLNLNAASIGINQ